MTTIAYKSGLMAFDTKAVGGTTYAGKVVKAVNLPDRVVGAAGAVQDVAALLDWQRAGGTLEQRAKFFLTEREIDVEAIIVMKDTREVYLCESNLYPYKLDTKFTAIGSGGSIALGAMYMGASAAKAVEIASLVDVYTNNDVQVFALPLEKKRKKSKK